MANRAGGNVIDFVAVMEQCSAYAAAKRIDELFPTGNDRAANVTSETRLSSSHPKCLKNN
jgi:hypothetical protein